MPTARTEFLPCKMADIDAAHSAAIGSGPAKKPAGRPWYRSVAGKLLLAFALIVALTVNGAGLSITLLISLEQVLQRLIGVSMPAVTTALGIESNATQIAVSAAQLGNAENSVQLFAQNEKLLTQIQDLWTALAELRRIVGDTPTTRQLEQRIADIDGKVGGLNRAATEKILLTERRERLVDSLAPLIETLSTRVNELQNGAAGSAPVATETVSDLLRQIVALGGVTRVAISAKLDQVDALRERVTHAKIRLAAATAALSGTSPAGDGRSAGVTAAADALLREIEGANGLLSIRERETRSAQMIAGLQGELQKAGDDLRSQVRTLVSQAETDSAATTERSLEEIAKSRLWLALIAASSLLLAGLVVWLFVYRYVIARLTGLSNSMLAIAQGDLAAPIPAGRVDELGDMSHALIVFRDNAREIYSAREEAEKARAEAEAASRTKSAFLANMSHELRTPLNAIIGYSEILVEDATDRGDDTTIADLQKIQAAGKHLLGLINDILDLSKIEAGRMDVYLEQVYLTRLVDEVKTIVEPMVTKNGNKLVIECPPDIGSLRTDLTKLKQSLINLLSNAAKFTRTGNVTLRLSRAIGADGLSRVSFAVVDSGIGMNDEQIGRLFQAFTQADSSTTRNFGGTGLGLTISKHFCVMLGGSIDVASKPGEGSTFTIVLPDQALKHTTATRAAFDESAGQAAPALSPSAMTVLVVDDDPIVHDVLTATLSKEGYRLMYAGDGVEALDIMRKTRPDVVTLDVMMPKMDGWSVLGAMKSDAELADIPVIMLTIVDDRTLGYSLGASEFMTKPIDRGKLVALLRRFSPAVRDGLVLIVDDDPDTRQMLKSTVEGEGLKAAEAGNGRIALDWLDRNPQPALVLLDIMMPEVDGFAFLERVREREDLAELPVVVLTAKDLTDGERNFLAERTILVLSKSAQPIGTLGAALAAIAGRAHASRVAAH
jgi:signal transduction histidine kinase/CheY-like chemotaxis protein